MKIFRRILLGLVCLFLIIWGGALLKCEILTSMHGDEFDEVYQREAQIYIDYLKVLEYRDDYARVYYVGEGKSIGEVVIYKKYNDNWAKECWTTIWSGVGGSASEVIWPYWWHFIYGGF